MVCPMAENRQSNPSQQSAAMANRALVGFLDTVQNETIVGWAQIPFEPRLPAIVDISIDQHAVGSVKANVFRDDLREQGIREGFAGFRFAIPVGYQDGV